MVQRKGEGRNLSRQVPAAMRELGENIRQVRQARGMRQKRLGELTGYSEGYVSRTEAGIITPSYKFVEGCDRVFGTGALFARQLKSLTEGEHPSWFGPYIDAEREAAVVQDYSIAFIMGLLQTEAYARAVLEQGMLLLPPEEVAAQTRSRMRRREIWDRATPPRVWVILHEACLRAEVGSPRIMADQLGFILAEMVLRPTLTVQVLPYSAAATATNTPFTILEVPETAPVLYVEGPQGGRSYDRVEELRNAQRTIDHLRACALSPHDSAVFLSRVRDEHARAAVDQVELQRRYGRSVRRVGPGARVRRGCGLRAGQQGR
ncbi:helix-turn-helix transcriptional regulator [Streptomyces sp. NRRL F-5053]|uniref:helix-turn-helix domain-containing protein n=1 Tax=Streptomyces sp. NRRL F-5053 TaxID=1463854 RepID=UPI002D21DA32|nr:helix-turn-helix transcriptional regulator [Streptomyces sp. NRRL F-5053]